MKKFFKNNKGFTLVEMIIVIAVMAILTVVVAPQYIKYVEKSRIGTDKNAFGELKHMVEISYVEAQAAGKTDAVVEVSIDATSGALTYKAATGDLDAYVVKVYPADSYEFKSNSFKTLGDVKFTVDPDTGICTTDKDTTIAAFN